MRSNTGRPGPAARLLLMVIRGYQIAFSPFYAGSCRYLPSCSAYALEAVERFGVLRGGRMALRRLARCHPLGGHGLDPVPDGRSSECHRGGAAAAQTFDL